MFDDRSPIYRQIAEQIKADILNEHIAPDEQVMSTNQYAAFHKINPATAAKAFQELMDEGLIYKKRGIGMFVSPDAREKLTAERRERFFADRIEPMVQEARAIGISLRSVIHRLEQFEKEDR